MTPDIASLADPNTGVLFIVNGQYMVIGGTSVAAPTVAGFLAAIRCTQFVNPLLYRAPYTTCFHDIVRGSMVPISQILCMTIVLDWVVSMVKHYLPISSIHPF